MTSWLDKYVGVPFSDTGQDLKTGCNCYALIRRVFADEAGVDLPPHTELSAAEAKRANAGMLADIAVGDWLPALAPVRKFDVLLMRGMPMHVGVAVDPNRVLHVWRATHSVIMSIDHPYIRYRKIAFYRHRSLA